MYNSSHYTRSKLSSFPKGALFVRPCCSDRLDELEVSKDIFYPLKCMPVDTSCFYSFLDNSIDL